MHILMTGSIRPSLQYVIDSITNIKTIFPNAITHILYWDTTESDKEILMRHFDNVYPCKEPCDTDIYTNITSRTKQQVALKTIEHWTITIYKMFYGVRKIIDSINIDDNDIIIRIRTDIQLNQIKEFPLNIIPNHYYFCPRRSGGNSCDYFGICDFNTFKRMWYYKDDNTYNKAISKSWCAETVLLDNARTNIVNLVDINSYFKTPICRKYIDNIPTLDIRHP